MKLLFITLVTVLFFLHQAEGGYKVIRMGGYLWVSLDGKPYIRLARDGHDIFLSQEAEENALINDFDANASNTLMNEPESMVTNDKEQYGTVMKRNNPMWNYVPRKKSNQKRLSYIRLSKKDEQNHMPIIKPYEKRLNYVRLA